MSGSDPGATTPDWDALRAAWEPARSAGVLGPTDLETLADHAAGFVPAAWRVPGPVQAVDLGTGAGVPGVFLALTLPATEWLLVDASARRAEMAAAAVRALGLGSRVVVRHARAEEIARDPDWRSRTDLVVARLFGDVAEVAECGGPLVATAGHLVVSVTDETAARWRTGDWSPVGLTVADEWRTPSGRYLALRGTGRVDERWPRRPAARRRDPLG